MNKLLSIMLILFSLSAMADDKKDKRHRIYNITPYCIFDVIPLNSPVKESVARFLIKTPDRFDIDEVSYQVKNSGRIFERPRAYQKINLVEGLEGKELRINVSKLPPGFYQLLVTVKDRSRKEHHFKTKFKDHAMFVIDNSLEVPMPDSKKNDATVAGVDSDNDGIRDDIQRWINEEFNSQPKVKLAMRQIAIGRQLDLLSVDDKAKSILSGKKYLDDLTCLRVIAGFDERGRLSRELNSKLLNTKDRLYADVKANANFSGQAWSYPIDAKALCSFNPDEL